MKNVLAIVLLIFAPVILFGQTFTGTIGKIPVYLELDNTGAEISGRYCYQKKGLNIGFSGERKGKQLLLTTVNYFSEQGEEVFKLTPNGTGWKGTWAKAGKQLAVSLQLIKSAPANRFANNRFVQKQSMSTYQQLVAGLYKLSDLDSIVYTDGKRLRYFEEIHSSIPLFRIDSGLPELQMKTANEFLESIQLSEFLSFGECSEYANSNTEYNFDVSGILIQSGILSFLTHHYNYCGGPHPNYYETPVCLDLHNGEEIKLQKALTELAVEENPLQTDDDGESLTNFSAFLFKYVQKHYPEEMAIPEDAENDDRCPFYSPNSWQYISYSIEREGLRILFDFPYVLNYCNDSEWVIIPYSELKGFIEPQLLERLIKIKP